jgi:hypothetical protein
MATFTHMDPNQGQADLSLLTAKTTLASLSSLNLSAMLLLPNHAPKAQVRTQLYSSPNTIAQTQPSHSHIPWPIVLHPPHTVTRYHQPRAAATFSWVHHRRLDSHGEFGWSKNQAIFFLFFILLRLLNKICFCLYFYFHDFSLISYQLFLLSFNENQ